MQRVVKVNAAGLRVGEDHPRANLTDEEVELIRSLYEERACGYRKLAQMFEVSKSAIRGIVRYQRRAQAVAGHKTVRIPDEE